MIDIFFIFVESAWSLVMLIIGFLMPPYLNFLLRGLVNQSLRNSCFRKNLSIEFDQ